ncbi:hypothetical protein GLW00_05210 [Halobacillus litoralis]|uniref:GDYXXLXY domain-containing protein n=1 Tax=Halobacillus litoralis TaxID=45668 RepID=A0A845F973_9BACI|nr:MULTISPECIES: GDYXXLXY domain-containing protein [Halobacillus]MBN9655807.1 GDYXXLXY domain-containing protein [Halobacillus sp. GSS1]MEC3883710.1 GDYXXLXY domain-containing protein [Halobacillus sp. HZG1]MYL70236.1 hypothetical protein [Halobacillus litoralis]
MKQRSWFYGLVTLQILFLLLMSASYYVMDIWGQTITLKTAPVDPRDPFYGDYVTLDYAIERVPEEKWSVDESLNRGEKVFLLLEENDEKIYELVEASTLWPETEDNQVVLTAKYQWSDPSLQQYQVDIGLGRYYIEENTGAFWEQREEREVEVILAPWKQKKIASLK